MGPTGLTTEERFWKRVTKTKSCWFWDKINSFGYGKFAVKINGKWSMQWSHRIAYEFEKGAIPKHLELDHLCRNRLCVNPAHLEAIPKKENLLRGGGSPAENARKTHCQNGHELKPDNLLRGSKGRKCGICSRAWWKKYRSKEAHISPRSELPSTC